MFTYESPREETRCGATPFFAALHKSLEGNGPDAAYETSRERTRIGEWQTTYDQLYSESSVSSDDAFDIVGWSSSYTGEPLSENEMREQVDATVARIAALEGRRILEIGCGTGLLLFGLAGHCERYTGTDFSSKALDRVRNAAERRGWAQVELWHREADDFSGIADGSFDVVVLNSVIQYMPGIDYLLRVLEGAARVVRPGGFIFAGDIRHRGLARLLYAGIEVAWASEMTSAGESRAHIDRRAAHELELLLDPEFFRVLPGRFGGVTASFVEVKRGRHHNELTRFRYDAVLQIGGAVPAFGNVNERRWSDVRSLDGIRASLREQLPLRVRGVPNARLTSEIGLFERLQSATATLPAVSLRSSEAEDSLGVDPEDCAELARELGCDVHVSWSLQDDPATLDVVFVPAGTGTLRGAEAGLDKKPWADYANVPMHGSTQHLVQALRESLRRKLPEYMVPSTFVCIDSLPLTANGKLNRRALLPPDPSSDVERVHAPPETELQRQITGVWREILGFEKVSIDANFFNVGGHSLLATQIISRCSDIVGINIPLRLMFEKPTIRRFADSVEQLRGGPRAAAAPPVVASRATDLASIEPDTLTDDEVNALLVDLLARPETRDHLE
jgi:2-polyprenyl-3-methyl-5-hydroxy-6-metoxy-1,4-benzoquinol methylase